MEKSPDNVLEFKSHVERSWFFNSVNPASDPDSYLNLLNELATSAMALSKTSKIVVNTCGWVEGLGAEMLTKFAKLMDKPST